MDGAMIAAVLAGVSGLVTAIGGILIQLRRAGVEDATNVRSRLVEVEEELEQVTRALEAARRLVRTLRLLLADNGIDVPEDSAA